MRLDSLCERKTAAGAKQQLAEVEMKGRGDATVCNDRISILKEGNKKHLS